ncbi:putative phage abortive infection protein [Acinetobacter pittii]|uniref:putative phage abortive infection protein n=1 Tax=Acinetobacter pittii TaxID=48296 RepID=UPI00355B9774
MNEIQIKNKVYWAIGIVVLIVVLVVGTFIFNFHDAEFAKESDKWGQFGDYIGGTLNPILAFLSFSALLFTIYIQVKQLNFADEQLKRTLDELNLSRTELALTRSELQRSADAQTGAKQVMEQQLLTQSMQQFDSIFFAMLKDLNSLLENLEIKSVGQESLLDKIYEQVINEKVYRIDEQRRKLLEERELCRYFILLYQLLKNIDRTIGGNTYINPNNKDSIKKTYSNIVRASISEKAMQLLMINVLNDGFELYKDLVEFFSFFEHTSFYKKQKYNLFLVNVAFSLKQNAFGKSQYFEKLKQSNLYSKYIVHTDSYNYGKLFWSIFSKLDNDGRLKEIEKLNSPRSKYYYVELTEKVHDSILQINLSNISLVPYQIQKIITKENRSKEILKSWECVLKFLDNDILSIVEKDTNRELINFYFDETGSFDYQVSDVILLSLE